MSRLRLPIALLLGAVLLPACSDYPTPTDPLTPAAPSLNVRVEIGKDSPGPPFYSLIQEGWFPMTEEWAAVAWIR